LLHLAASRGYDFKRWQDHDVLLGEEWNEAIISELERHRIALLLLTPTFLVRPYILREGLGSPLTPSRAGLGLSSARPGFASTIASGTTSFASMPNTGLSSVALRNSPRNSPSAARRARPKR